MEKIFKKNKSATQLCYGLSIVNCVSAKYLSVSNVVLINIIEKNNTAKNQVSEYLIKLATNWLDIAFF